MRRGSFATVRQLETAIHEYVAKHVENPVPFRWTADADVNFKKVACFGLRTSDSGR